MNIEKGKISNFQFSLLIAAHLEGTVFLISYVANLAGHDTWLTILSALVVIAPFVSIYALLTKKFPGLNFARINQLIYGRCLGITIAWFYFGYYLLLLSFTIKDVSDFYIGFFMQDTPLIIISIVFTCVCGYAVGNGIEVLARLALLVVTSLSAIIVITTFMLLPKLNFANFLPIGELPLINLIHSTQILAEIPFGTALTAYIPIAFVANDHKGAVRTFLSGLLLATVFFMVISIRNTAVLGGAEAILASPSYQVSRLIKIGFLSRMEILSTVGHIFGIFLYCSVLFYSTVLFLSQILGLRAYRPLLFPLGGVAIILGHILYPSSTEHFQSAQNLEMMLWIPFVFIFPLLSLLIAKIRNLPKEAGNKK